MDYFAGALLGSADSSVVYHKSHDEAGNSDGSMRTIVAAVNGNVNALSNQQARRYAEARCRFAFGMSLTSPGIPMFLFGEEIAAEKPNTYNRFAENKEDLLHSSANGGGRIFEFYRDLIRFRLGHQGLRYGDIQVIHSHNANRVIAFGRFHPAEDLIIVGSLNNDAFENGYVISHPAIGDSEWREVFNSDDTAYGGWGTNNQNRDVHTASNEISVIVPAAGFVILQRNY
jgi:1,4-alpha-glucan branching enzyme